jgi:PAS domain S-box-containing protein
MASSALTESLEETLALFDATGTPLTTNEVAERLDLGRRSTYDRLDRLVDHDRLATKKVGASARVWWRRQDTEGAFEEGETALSRLVNNVPGVVYRCTDEPGWPMRFVSDAVADLTGYDPERIVDGDVDWQRDLVAPSDREEVRDRIEDQLVAGDEFTVTYRIETATGEERWVREHGTAVTTTEDGTTVLEGFVTDVTEQVRTERRVAEREHQFRSLVEATDEYAIFMVSPDGTVETWNSGAEQIKGYDADEVVGEHFSIFYTDTERADRVPERNLAAAARDGSTQDEGWRVRADGSRFWASVTITALRDDDGDLEGFAKVTRDLTERREYEERLRTEKAHVESLFDIQQDLVYALDADGAFTRVNDRVGEVTRFAEEDLDGRPFVDILPESAREEARRAIETVQETRESLTVELPVAVAQGETVPYEFTISPLTDGDESVGLTGIGRDVTERKEKERRLERQRDDLEAELTEVFDRVDDAFFALDEQWRFTHVNDRAAELLDRSPGTLVGKTVWDEFPAAARSGFRRRHEHAMETQESVTFEEYFPPLDTWFEVRAHPSESGLSVYFRDVTDRKRRERELERYETIVETIQDGIYVVDEDGYFTDVNDRYAEMVGRDRADIIGAHVSEVVQSDVSEAAKRLEDELASGERDTASMEAELTDGEGGTWTGEATFSLFDSGEGHERVAVVRDVTERKERERELERYETIVETVDDGIYALDDAQRFVLVNDAFCELTGYSRDELLGSHAELVHDADVSTDARDVATSEDGRGKVVAEVETKTGERVPCETQVAGIQLGGAEGRCGVVRDVSERQARERELERRVRQQEVVTELGNRALSMRDPDDLFREAAELVAETLDNEYAKVLELEPDGESLHLRQGVGWDDGVVGEASVSAVEDDSQAAYTLASEEPVVVDDLEAETRFSGPSLLTDHEVRGGISTLIGPVGDPWGILGTHDTEAREFAERDVRFVQSVANILGSAVDRYEYELALEHQSEQLRALNNLNEVVQGITEAVIDQSTRENIEQTVCEHLAASESYRFAWMGEVDVDSQTVSVSTEAGVTDYLSDITISVDPADPDSRGPTGRAFLTGEMQTSSDVQTDPEYERWADHAAEHGYRSAAAIPVTHEGTVYGVLNVYAARPDAFEGREAVAFEQLGEVVGHAIAANERKRALMSDEVVELEFLISGVFDALSVPVETAGTITLDDVVPVECDEYLVYGTVTPDAEAGLASLVETLPHWQAVTYLEEGEDRRQFELKLSEPPVISTVASVGGAVDSAIIEDGDFRMTVHLGTNVDVRQVIDAIEDVYPGVELLKRQQLQRDGQAGTDLRTVVDAELTDRQRTTLEAAFHGGFFEWPRAVSGEDVAESLDIAPSTFHQHLRKAERKVFEQVLTSAFASPSA